MDTDELTQLSARSEIWSLLNRYARGADRCDWPLVRACYHEDAHDDHGLYRGGVDGLMDFLIHTAAHFEGTSHQLTNHLAEVDGDQARCETGCTCWYRRIDRQGNERVIVQGLRYLDQLERRAGRWAIAQRVVVLDWEQVLQPQAASPINAGWQRGARGTADPSAHFFLSLAAASSPAATPHSLP